MTIWTDLQAAIEAKITALGYTGTLANLGIDQPYAPSLRNLLDLQADLYDITGSGGGSSSETGFIDYRNTALTNTASQIKATAGQTRGWNFINPNTIPVYVKFYNALAINVVVGTTAVVRTLAIPSGGAFFLEAQSVSQDDFLTAISIACVTGLADNSTVAPAISIHAGVRYK